MSGAPSGDAPGPRGGWQCARVLLLLLAAVALALAAAWLYVGHWLEGPARPPTKADLIVLLGGDSKSRLIAGLELYRQGMAPAIFIAGSEMLRLPPGHAAPNLRLQFLVDEGVPRDAIIVDELSSNSWEEAGTTFALMKRSGWRKALVVSDPPHMRRLAWIWGRVFAGSGIEPILVASRPEWWNAGEWWRDEWSGTFVLMELIKIGYYFAVR